MNAALTIRLFGPMRVLLGDEPMPHVRSRKALWLMALLVLRHGRPTTRHGIASALWPDVDASMALTNLRPVVSELRRALGIHGERLHSPDRETLIMDLEGANVDVVEFDQAIKSGNSAKAVALYTGTLLEGCPEEWVYQERNTREADCLTALERLADDALSSGNPRRAAELYARASAIDPLREPCRRGQMAALSANGDVNAALAVYREFAQVLSTQVGLAPGAETTALYERLRTSHRTAPANAARSEDGNLPHPADPLVGRDDERAEVAALLRRSSLVTLIGPGGIGKTRLGIAVAGDVAIDYPDGVWFVPLDGLREGSRLVSALAETFGIRETRHQTLESAIHDRLRSRRALLVLDNCEHLLGDCERICGGILASCPQVRVLATSREPLGVKGERSWAVPALAYPDPDRLPTGRTTALRFAESFDSIQLFAQRAHAISQAFELGPDNLAQVASICARLEGVPLAIELAAAQTRSMDVAEIAERLDDALRLLTVGAPAKRGRQHALRATMDWSYELLAEDERRLLGMLSIFVDGWCLEAAQAIGQEEVAGILGALVDKSLVGFDLVAGRYRLLEIVRQYASERLATAGDDESQSRRHRARWCIELAEAGSQALMGPDQSRWLDRLQIERGNLLAALSDLEQDPAGGLDGLRLSAALARFWDIRGPRTEGIDRLRRALDHPGAQDDSEARNKALNAIGILLFHAVSPAAARPWAEATLASRRRLGGDARFPAALVNLANVLLFEGDHLEARRLYEESIEITRKAGDKPSQAISLFNLANLLNSHVGEALESRKIYEQTLALMREIGEPRGIAIALEGIGYSALAQGEYDVALAHQGEALTMLQDLNDQGVSWSSYHLGEIAHARGEPSVALGHYDEGLRHFTKREDHDGMARSYQGRGKCLLELGKLESAHAEFETSLRLHRQVGRSKSIGEAMIAIALAESDLERFPEAAAHLTEAMATLRKVDARRGLAVGLDAVAEFLTLQGEPWLAVRLWAAAEEERRRTGSAPRIPERERNLRAGEKAKARLGSTGFLAAWRDGENLRFEDATAEALQAMEARTLIK